MIERQEKCINVDYFTEISNDVDQSIVLRMAAED